jgi:phosphoribosylaminoimidazolecarboxamide formyltransferase/IMP cyclohydrolase
MKKIKRALLSVAEKCGIIEFARGLTDLRIELIATGGTAKLIREAGINLLEVSEITSFPEILGGRVKTLHPKIFGGILANREDNKHLAELRKEGISEIDLIVVNLYPFAETARNKDATISELIKNIDIGGVSLIRAGAKNFQDVAVIVDPEDYQLILDILKGNDGSLDMKTRLRLADKAFNYTADYDALISGTFERLKVEEGKVKLAERLDYPETLRVSFNLKQKLRYGENPHQKAALYIERDEIPAYSVVRAEKLQGKELSFNNLVDFEAALLLAREFTEPTAVIIKHTNPCGVGIGEDALTAYKRAKECDPMSAFGSIIAFNRKVDEKLATEVTSTFVEGVIAPEITEPARKIFARKKNLRLLRLPMEELDLKKSKDYRRLVGGLLVQDRDELTLDESRLKVVTRREPGEKELKALYFAWRVVKHTKSNAVVFTNEHQTVGVGAGQMSRVDSVKLAAEKARLPLEGTVLASDAFFPFRDGIDAAYEAGARAVIQPGGSIRDEEVIAAADEHGMAMVFTGIRHFRH